MNHDRAMIELTEKREETSKRLTLATDLRDGGQVCGTQMHECLYYYSKSRSGLNTEYNLKLCFYGKIINDTVV